MAIRTSGKNNENFKHNKKIFTNISTSTNVCSTCYLVCFLSCLNMFLYCHGYLHIWWFGRGCWRWWKWRKAQVWDTQRLLENQVWPPGAISNGVQPPHPPAPDIHFTIACQVRLFRLVCWYFTHVCLFQKFVFSHWQKSIGVSFQMSSESITVFPKDQC